PLAALLHERSKHLEAELSGVSASGLQAVGSGFWVRQRSPEGQSIINATSSREQGVNLGSVTVFSFDLAGQFVERIEAKSAVLESGYWRLTEARIYPVGSPPVDRDTHALRTHRTPEQARESFSTPETVPFWQPPEYI